ncbi:MAG: hypothetical protein J7L77_00050 [Clostridiales bacterium]|nr:hypothetical protein [Clostridiales bacterium]
MGDIFIDCRPEESKNISLISNMMKFYDDIKLNKYESDKFNMLLSRPDDWNIWGPYQNDNHKIFVALAGRIAMDSPEWEKAKEINGTGGLACKAIYQKYKSGGLESLSNLNGNFVVFIHDATKQKLYIITDRCGMFPCYFAHSNDNEPVFCSHADILATSLGISSEWDMTSMAEFLITGRVSFPHSYYKDIKALEYGYIHTIDLSGAKPVYEAKQKYFDFDFQIDQTLSEWDIAEELAAAFTKAMNRRTLPIFGQAALSLSGGLDSRTLLCSPDNKDDIWTICFYDEENLENQIAKSIATAANAKFIPLKRDFDHYGNNAEMGVRISGGMGDFGNNHYLGFRDKLLNLGIDNIIAGFYCDYLFKGLVFDKKYNKYLRHESLTDFKYDNYMPYYWFDTQHSTDVKERIDAMFPESLRKDNSETAKLQIAHRRIFPFYSEPDNQETIIPQRVMGWYLPIVDSDIINVYLKVPPKFKLNTSMYSKMAELQCGKKISKIMDVNTGTKVNAPWPSIVAHGYKRALQRRFQKRKESIATDESWPNWPYYIYNSNKIHSLWERENHTIRDIFTTILGENPFEKNIREYDGRNLKLFLRLLNLKLWIDQRI